MTHSQPRSGCIQTHDITGIQLTLIQFVRLLLSEGRYFGAEKEREKKWK